MEADRLDLAGSFCWNRGCTSYGKVDQGNIVRYGRTAKGTQRLKCKICGNVFVGSETAAAHPDASIGASKAPPHGCGTRLRRSKPRLNTYALYPRCKHRGIVIKIKGLYFMDFTIAQERS